jgi:Restriction Enzyme Adenine Methylase Associated
MVGRLERRSKQGKPPRSGSPKHYTETLKDLLDAGLLAAGVELRPARKSVDAVAVVEADGQLRIGSESYETPSGAAKAAAGTVSEPGWNFWTVSEGGTIISLFELRQRLRGRAEAADV